MENEYFTLDTNVFLRAIDRKSQDFPAASNALLLLQEKQIPVCISPQILFESWVVITRPKEVNGLGLSLQEAESFLQETRELFPCFQNTENLFEKWFELVREYKISGKRSHDVRLIAWMLLREVNTIVTFNVSDFSSFPIRVIHPSDLPSFLE